MVKDPILSLALFFIFGFFGAKIIKKLKMPTITAYIGLGILMSPSLLNLVSPSLVISSNIFSNIALGMIAFMLGESFSLKTLNQIGNVVFKVSLAASVFPWIVVTSVLWLALHQPFAVSLVLGAIAAATDPAATVMVVQEYKSRGEFTDNLLGVVAVDDIWALIIFAISLSLAQTFAAGHSAVSEIFTALGESALEIIGSSVVGFLVAVIFNKLSRFISTVKERLIYTLGFLFFVIGFSITFNLSVLLSCMVFGAVLINTNKTSFEFFKSLREIDSPIYLIFFVLAGASLQLNYLTKFFFLTVGFILLRVFGKMVGAFFGAKLSRASANVQKYMGLALIPQAGVALACALLAKHALGDTLGNLIVTITIASTVIFELGGPLLTKYCLVKTGEIKEG